MNKKIMIIGAGILQLPASVRAKELGYEVIAVDKNPNAIGFKYADEKCIVSTNDITGILLEADKHKPNGVMTLATDMPVRSVAAVGEMLHLNALDRDTALRVTDKSEMRKTLLKNGVPIPKFIIVNNYAEYIDAVAQFNEDFIVKPVDSSGSRGIFLVKDKSQVKEAYNYSVQNSSNGKILVEEYMRGHEVSVETFSINGIVNIIAITDKVTTGAPHFVELGHSIPSLLDNNIQEQIKNVAQKAIKSVGIENGPSHTEIIVTEEGPKIVEIGARLGGDNISTYLVPLATGVSMIDLNIRYALNEEISINQTMNKASMIRYLSSRSGQVTQILGVEDARSIKGVITVEMNKNVGDYVGQIKSSNDRIGYVISQADTVDEAEKICINAINKIKIITI